jgi:hypothetical protein
MSNCHLVAFWLNVPVSPPLVDLSQTRRRRRQCATLNLSEFSPAVFLQGSFR